VGITKKINYVAGSEEDGARFWLQRTGWQPSCASKAIASRYPKDIVLADIGGAHGRDALWLAEQGFKLLLIEPNRYSLQLAREKARKERLMVELLNAALPNLPLADESLEVAEFYWGLHQIPDDYKLGCLKDIYRVLKPASILYSSSFGRWEGHSMPPSIHPIREKSDFLKLHEIAGFEPLEVSEMSDEVNPFEKFWYGEFRRLPKLI
jgi:ubiquinone/menaquinone biosynthesis C-methylase UbiE